MDGDGVRLFATDEAPVEPTVPAYIPCPPAVVTPKNTMLLPLMAETGPKEKPD